MDYAKRRKKMLELRRRSELVDEMQKSQEIANEQAHYIRYPDHLNTDDSIASIRDEKVLQNSIEEAPSANRNAGAHEWWMDVFDPMVFPKKHNAAIRKETMKFSNNMDKQRKRNNRNRHRRVKSNHSSFPQTKSSQFFLKEKECLEGDKGRLQNQTEEHLRRSNNTRSKSSSKEMRNLSGKRRHQATLKQRHRRGSNDNIPTQLLNRSSSEYSFEGCSRHRRGSFDDIPEQLLGQKFKNKTSIEQDESVNKVRESIQEKKLFKFQRKASQKCAAREDAKVKITRSNFNDLQEKQPSPRHAPITREIQENHKSIFSKHALKLSVSLPKDKRKASLPGVNAGELAVVADKIKIVDTPKIVRMSTASTFDSDVTANSMRFQRPRLGSGSAMTGDSSSSLGSFLTSGSSSVSEHSMFLNLETMLPDILDTGDIMEKFKLDRRSGLFLLSDCSDEECNDSNLMMDVSFLKEETHSRAEADASPVNATTDTSSPSGNFPNGILIPIFATSPSMILERSPNVSSGTSEIKLYDDSKNCDKSSIGSRVNSHGFNLGSRAQDNSVIIGLEYFDLATSTTCGNKVVSTNETIEHLPIQTNADPSVTNTSHLSLDSNGQSNMCYSVSSYSCQTSPMVSLASASTLLHQKHASSSTLGSLIGELGIDHEESQGSMSSEVSTFHPLKQIGPIQNSSKDSFAPSQSESAFPASNQTRRHRRHLSDSSELRTVNYFGMSSRHKKSSSLGDSSLKVIFEHIPDNHKQQFSGNVTPSRVFKTSENGVDDWLTPRSFMKRADVGLRLPPKESMNLSRMNDSTSLIDHSHIDTTHVSRYLRHVSLCMRSLSLNHVSSKLNHCLEIVSAFSRRICFGVLLSLVFGMMFVTFEDHYWKGEICPIKAAFLETPNTSKSFDSTIDFIYVVSRTFLPLFLYTLTGSLSWSICLIYFIQTADELFNAMSWCHEINFNYNSGTTSSNLAFGVLGISSSFISHQILQRI
mmetsp:Transcript_53173/g.64057  ORF Transcript_53173/g.64057 Transcript_53173/m.64057 type:complete len:982 (+) Transcript_53173:139-3084(+)